MVLLALGGDERNAAMAKWARKLGVEARCAGHECSDPAADGDFAARADAVVLPDARILDSAPYAYLGARMKKDAALYAYACPRAAKETRGRRVVDLLEDEVYVRGNAILTAEAALVRMGDLSRGALWGSRCVVTGYGRIGQALVERLLAMGAQVCVAARREESRMRAREMGAAACDMRDVGRALADADFVFGTVPARVLRSEDLTALPKRAIVMDLASAPYGFDAEEAAALGVRFVREGGLPGRYCPETAGKLMLEAVLRQQGEGRICASDSR